MQLITVSRILGLLLMLFSLTMLPPVLFSFSPEGCTDPDLPDVILSAIAGPMVLGAWLARWS